MGSIANAFVETFRDYVTAGVPASGAHKPVKAETRALGTMIESAMGVLSLGGVDVTKDTRANLNADLAHAADSVGLVYADATDANNDLYVKVGGSGTGSWTLTTVLHDVIAGAAQPFVDLAEAWAEGTEPDGPGTKSAKEWALEAAADAGSLAGILPQTRLPASVEALYPCDEASGTSLRDIVNGHTATLTAIGAVGAIGWTKDGFVELIGSAFLLPAMSHRAIAIIFQQPEGDETNSPLFCSSSSERMGRHSAVPGEVSAVRIMDGLGIATPRIASTGALVALEGGDWQMPCATFAGTRSSTPAIGANAVSPTLRAAYMKIAGIVVFNTAPSDADLRKTLNYLRPTSAARGVWLTPEDCPEEATLLCNDGESLDDGRFGGLFTGSMTGSTVTIGATLRGQMAEGAELVANGVSTGRFILPLGSNGTSGTGGNGTYALDGAVSTATGQTFTTMGLSKAQQDAVAECLYVNAFNSAGAFPLGRYFERYSTKPPYANSSAVGLGPVVLTGWDVGLRDALIQRPHDGRKKFLLKLGMGSTYLTRAGDGSSTVTSFITKGSFTGATVAGNVLTVPAQTVAGAIMAGDTLLGSGVTADTLINAYGSGGTTGTGGAGTYQLSKSMTVGSGTAMTTGFTLGQSSSRNPGVWLPYGLTTTVHERFLRRQEVWARGRGIGFTTVIFITSEGLNDASLGDNAIASASAYQAMLQAKYDYYGQVTGIYKPTWILMKPHLPYGSVSPTGNLGGPDTDYPNNQMGQSRLNALNFIRTACDSVKAANLGSIFTIDWNLYDMNNGVEYVHPSAQGNVDAGKAIDALLRKRVRMTAAAASGVLTVSFVDYGVLEVGMELAEGMNATRIPPGTVISSLGSGLGGAGTYNLSASITFASSPMNTVELYRKRVTAAA